MYQIAFSPKSLKKVFEAICKETKHEQGAKNVLGVFKNYPKGNATTHGIIEKKNIYWGYDLSRGNRITYKVYDREYDQPTVIIYFIGNHNDYMRFLRTHAKG